MDYTAEIQQALAYIETNLAEEISLATLAAQVGLSQFHFQRVFKKQLNSGLYHYIQQRRMGQAALLLLQSELRILDIALSSGFSSQEAFSRTFKRYYNLPPAQFRQQFKYLFRRNEQMSDEKIKGWLISGSNFGQYEVEMDHNHFHSGLQAVKLSGQNQIQGEDFITVMQQISATNYQQQRIRVSAYLKSADITGWGGLWFRIDGQNFEQLKFDNMQDRPIVGTNEWNYYSTVLDVPAGAAVLNFGFLLQGEGSLWADDFCVESVSTDIPTTDFNPGETYQVEPQNLSFSE